LYVILLIIMISRKSARISSVACLKLRLTASINNIWRVGWVCEISIRMNLIDVDNDYIIINTLLIINKLSEYLAKVWHRGSHASILPYIRHRKVSFTHACYPFHTSEAMSVSKGQCNAQWPTYSQLNCSSDINRRIANSPHSANVCSKPNAKRNLREFLSGVGHNQQASYSSSMRFRFEQIGQKMGRDEVWVAAVFYGQVMHDMYVLERRWMEAECQGLL
jgi:hypothetical protein